MVTLGNNIITVSVKEHGAELCSIRKGGVEYLWQADPAFWARHSPVLFPIVGSVWEGKFRVDGKEYAMGQHGFARDMDFTLVSQTDTEVRYRLESSEETLVKYPWPFVLEIAYRVHDNKVDVIWEVTNPGDKDMPFQIGAHPAFYYPDYDPQTKDRGFFSFDRLEGIEYILISEKGCAETGVKYPMELKDGKLPLDTSSFDRDAFIIEDSQVGKVTLHRQDGTPWLSLSFDAPLVGLWSPPGKNAPFICIEPWYGRCDRAHYEGEYKDKDWMNVLAPGERFSSVYTIEVE